MIRLFERFINHPIYMLACMAAGLYVLSFSFDGRDRQTQLQSLQLSSLTSTRVEMASQESRAIEQLTDREIVQNLERIKPLWNRPEGDYGVSLSALEAVEHRRRNSLPKRFEKNPVFKLFQMIESNSNSASIEYEDLLICDPSRQFYENKIEANPVLRRLSEARRVSPESMPSYCVTYSMKQNMLPKSNYAKCEKAEGFPVTPGAKPCVTPRMVNLTYNTYMDVMDCLGINPKHLMPKVDFDSGFFVNAFGADREAGIGQLTRIGISDVNSQLPRFLAEVEEKAPTNRACANLWRNRDFLNPASPLPEQRCSVIGMPENPLRSIFYLGIITRSNQEKIDKLLPLYGVPSKLEELGMKNADLGFFADVLVLLASHTGPQKAVELLDEYLGQRIRLGRAVTWADFDFFDKSKKTDVDGSEKPAIEVARALVYSSIIDPKDTPEVKELKVQRRRLFEKAWRDAATETFPIYAALRANSYKGKGLEKFSIFGYPGYVNVIADRIQNIQALFKNSDLEPNSCVDPMFLRAPSVQVFSVQN